MQRFMSHLYGWFVRGGLCPRRSKKNKNAIVLLQSQEIYRQNYVLLPQTRQQFLARKCRCGIPQTHTQECETCVCSLLLLYLHIKNIASIRLWRMSLPRIQAKHHTMNGNKHWITKKWQIHAFLHSFPMSVPYCMCICSMISPLRDLLVSHTTILSLTW